MIFFRILLIWLVFLSIGCDPKGNFDQASSTSAVQPALAQTPDESPESSKKAVPAAQYNHLDFNAVVAMVNGKPIHLKEVMNKSIHDQLNELHQELQKQIPLAVMGELAKLDQGYNINPDIKIDPAQVEEFYKQRNLQQHGSLDKLRPQIQDFLNNQARAMYFQEQLGKAQKAGLVEVFLEAPPEFLISVKARTETIRGNKNAQVMVLEFSDYQCPYCRRIQGTLTQLIEKYGQNVAFGYRHFPLAFHTEADEAAIAAECAGEHGKFFQLHEILFENQRQQHKPDLINYAKSVDIKDEKAFVQCLEEDRYRDLVNNDIQDGAQAGISGTPGFIIGQYNPQTRVVRGEVISGAQPQHVFEQLILKYLQ